MCVETISVSSDLMVVVVNTASWKTIIYIYITLVQIPTTKPYIKYLLIFILDKTTPSRIINPHQDVSQDVPTNYR